MLNNSIVGIIGLIFCIGIVIWLFIYIPKFLLHTMYTPHEIKRFKDKSNNNGTDI